MSAAQVPTAASEEPGEEGVGPLPEGGYPVPAPPTYPGPTRERWLWTAAVVGIGLLIFGLLVFGFSGAQSGIQPVPVADVLGSRNGPAQRFGSSEIHVVGWYAQVSGGACTGDSGGTDKVVDWLQAECPVRVLLSSEPAPSVTQSELLRDGLRLAAPNGQPFPPPAAVGSGTAGLEQLVFTGHFEDAASASCVPERVERCRNTFVVSGYMGLIK